MNRLFKMIAAVLILATVIQAVAAAYVLGFEHGVNFQQSIIQQLIRELNPDLLVDFFIWLHPLRNTLFGTSIILAPAGHQFCYQSCKEDCQTNARSGVFHFLTVIIRISSL